MGSKYISGKNNFFFKEMKKLKLKKYRARDKLFLAEGKNFLDYKENAKYILVSKSYENEYDTDDKIVIDDELFEEISTHKNSQGIILVFHQKKYDIRNIGDHIIVLDGIQDPGNMGTILRTAEAAGISDICLLNNCVDVYNEKTVRSTMGAINFVRPYIFTKADLIDFLKENEYYIISAALSEEAVDFSHIKSKKKSALVFGNEGNGICEEILKESDQILQIPIYGKSESLNVGVAAGIIIYKFLENEV